MNEVIWSSVSSAVAMSWSGLSVTNPLMVNGYPLLSARSPVVLANIKL